MSIKKSVFAACMIAGLAIIPFACEDKGGAAPPVTPPVTPPPTKLEIPSYWFNSDFDAWIGQRWDAVDLFQFTNEKNALKGMDTGTRYVVFYSRTCDHCEGMFTEDFATNADLAAKVIAVEVPDSKTNMTNPSGWAMPDTTVEMLELPLGCNWIITTPLAVHLEDGVIKCAIEGEHKECLGLE